MHPPSLLRADAFDEVRNFVRHDMGDGRVHTSENPLGVAERGKPVRGHYLAVQTMPSGLIVAQVSLHMRIRYVVHLMTHRLSTITPLGKRVAWNATPPRPIAIERLKRASA